MTIYGNDMVGLEISSSLLATLYKLKDVAFEVATAASTTNCEVIWLYQRLLYINAIHSKRLWNFLRAHYLIKLIESM